MLHKTKENRDGFTISIEPSWRMRYILICQKLSEATQTTIIPSHAVRDFIIQRTLKLEEELGLIRKRSDGKARR